MCKKVHTVYNSMKKLRLKSQSFESLKVWRNCLQKLLNVEYLEKDHGYAFDHSQAYEDENDEDPSNDPVDSSIGSDLADDCLLDYKDSPSLHEMKEKANVAASLSIRSSLLRVGIENKALQFMQSCTKCSSNPGAVRCHYCSFGVYYVKNALNFLTYRKLYFIFLRYARLVHISIMFSILLSTF